MIVYTNVADLKSDLDKLKAKSTGDFFFYRLKNKLDSSQSSVLINIAAQNISTEIQMIYYKDPNDVPTKGSKS